MLVTPAQTSAANLLGDFFFEPEGVYSATDDRFDRLCSKYAEKVFFLADNIVFRSAAVL
jgi:hypothetical protein